MLLSDCRHENLNLINVVLKEPIEVFSVAEPEKSPELLLEGILNVYYLLIDGNFCVFVYSEDIVKEEDWQLVWSAHLHFISAKKLDYRSYESRTRLLLSRLSQIIPGVESLSLNEVLVAVFVNYYH